MLCWTISLKWTFKLYVKFSQWIGIAEKWKSKTYGITATFNTLKYLSLTGLLDFSSMAEYFY